MRRRPFNVDWSGMCALCLSVGVSISMIIAMVGVTTHRPLSAGGVQLLSTVFGASVGAVATYLGMSRQQQQAQSRTRRSDEPRAQQPGQGAVTDQDPSSARRLSD